MKFITDLVFRSKINIFLKFISLHFHWFQSKIKKKDLVPSMCVSFKCVTVRKVKGYPYCWSKKKDRVEFNWLYTQFCAMRDYKRDVWVFAAQGFFFSFSSTFLLFCICYARSYISSFDLHIYLNFNEKRTINYLWVLTIWVYTPCTHKIRLVIEWW